MKLAGRYRLEEPLGRGGMGEVWRGVDLRLRRPVAVKILPLTVAAEPAGVARFRREAEVAATLNHPGITTVFDIDEHRHGNERWLFLVMELMVGHDLRHLLAASPEGLPIERATELAVQVADALADAHRRGVVHRDIKPANLFLLENGRVKICDFGIARLVDATKITATGSSAGTPLYMAPEQIQGEEVDQRTDLYAFGCVLYELLTGTTWLDTGSNVGAILYQHLNRTPAPPRSLRAEIPDHLDTLVLGLLAKQPDDRPQDAVHVAERLRPFVRGTTDTSEAARTPREQPDAQTTLTPTMTSPSAPPRIRRRTVLLGGLGAAALTVPVGFLLDAVTGTPNTSLTGHTRWISSVAFSPDGRTVATGSADDTARLWDVATRRTIATLTHTDPVYAVAFSPDGKTLATAVTDETVRLWDVATGGHTAAFAGHTSNIESVAFSPDGKTLASACVDNTVRLWDVATGRTTATLTQTTPVYTVAFSPDGKTVATGSYDNAAWLWDVATGLMTATFTGHTKRVDSVAFSPDGKTLATGSYDETVRLWDVATERTTATLDHSDAIFSLAFSPDGKTVATGCGDDTVRLWDVTTGRTTVTLDQGDGVLAVAFSPDGRTLASAGSDKTVRLWKIR